MPLDIRSQSTSSACVALLLAMSGCTRASYPDTQPNDSSTDSVTNDDTDTGTEPTEPPVRYTLEVVTSGTMPGLADVRAARVNPLNGYTYVLDDPSTTVRYLLDTWIHPTGDYCVGGTEDENGNCRGGGVVWTSGRIKSPKGTDAMCLDARAGLLYQIKERGQNVEIIDLAMEGADPYTYNRAIANPQLPAEVAASGTYVGACDVLPEEGTLVLTSPEQMGIAVLSYEDTFTLSRMHLLEFEPGDMTVSGETAFIQDVTHNRVVSLGMTDLVFDGSYAPESPIEGLAVERESGVVWLALGDGGVERVTFDERGNASVSAYDVGGAARFVVADGTRGIAWVAVESGGAWSVALLDDEAVRASQAFESRVLGLAEPAPGGDVPVFLHADDSAESTFTVLSPVAERQVLDPLNVFLFTTIEEPSDANMSLPCSGTGVTFEDELALIRNNAAVLATMGVPVVMAITDNFSEKAESCGQTAIYDELVGYGFELGVMLHNRPCYNCTDGSNDANPDYCSRSDPNWASSTSGAACFPDDPEYCAFGDWDCYHDFLAPRVDVADRNIPGGGAFIVGADRHGMWGYDWIRLYSEVERPSIGKTGYDLTMFAGAWAYNDIVYDDPRGKNPAPWRVDSRAAAWHLGDIDHWDQDAPRSDLLYLPGINSGTVKIAEQQETGLFMIDFFDVASDVAYRPDDFEVQWHFLRQAINNRRPGAINSWYFHIHDTGTLNLRDANNGQVMVDPDGDGPETSMASEDMLRDFIDRINTRYVPTGEVVWRYASEVRMLDAER